MPRPILIATLAVAAALVLDHPLAGEETARTPGSVTGAETEPTPGSVTREETELTAGSVTGGSTELTVAEVIRRVDSASRALETWRAAFQQTRHYVWFDQTDTRSGSIAFKRGRGLRLDVTEPDQETVVLSREEARQWRPKTRQLNVYPLPRERLRGEDFPIPLPFGDDGWDPSVDHEVELLPATGPEVVIGLKPHSDSTSYQSKTIWFDPDSWLPVKLQLVETTSDVVHFSFTAIERNGELDDDLFDLPDPEGAEIVKHTELPRLSP